MNNNTILLGLECSRVVSFTVSSKDMQHCVVAEECDGYFQESLTKQEMYQLSNEIKSIADTMDE